MKQDIISAYMNYMLEKGEQPKSMFSFAKELKVKESEIYKHFTSFDAIEKSIFGQFFDNTIEVLHKNDEYHQFDAKDKFLSFYYTFFEILTANRSYVLLSLQKGVMHPHIQNHLKELRSKIQAFTDELEITSIKIPSKRLNQFHEKSMSHLGWTHFVFVLDFWMKDVSPNFESTDILIEKSITTGVHLVQSEPLMEMVDLGKFLFKEFKQR